VRDTRLWAATRPDEPRRAGITRERERELLAAAPNPRTAEAPSG